MTAVAGSVFTAAQFNTFVRDDLNETAPAKALNPGGHFVTSATNQISERLSATNNVNTSETTTSTSYADLATAGPAVTVTTGAMCWVLVTATESNNTSGQNVYMSYAVTGASSVSATDDRALLLTAAATNQAMRATHVYLETGLTPGSNTFTAKYRVTGGTGSWSNRRIAALPL
jgi:hypothetical protein